MNQTSAPNSGRASASISTIPSLSIEQLINQLNYEAKTIDFDSEILSLSDDVSDLHKQLKEKSLYFSIIMSLGMESDDDNIKELRKQLFLAVKLIHGDLIEKLKNDMLTYSDMDMEDSYINKQDTGRLSEGNLLTKTRAKIRLSNTSLFKKLRTAIRRKEEKEPKKIRR